ncbi:hypothetical protein, partial [Parabacteroides goldsteinii]|uniref:hypothetical protein n=1 Tax=Parabacteroides goldsteinii TaxID=328812 RepID=UPI00259BA4EA
IRLRQDFCGKYASSVRRKEDFPQNRPPAGSCILQIPRNIFANETEFTHTAQVATFIEKLF